MNKTSILAIIFVLAAAIAAIHRFSISISHNTGRPLDPLNASQGRNVFRPDRSRGEGPSHRASRQPGAIERTPRQKWKEDLYNSPDFSIRWEAAQKIAATNDEEGMTDLASFICAAEEQGEAVQVELAKQVAGLLGEMRGTDIEPIATELAYSSSSLVAEAAVNAAVGSQQVESIPLVKPSAFVSTDEQDNLDAHAQSLIDSESDRVSE